MRHAPEQRPRCVVVVYRLPWPPSAGGSLRDWQNIVALASRTRLSVVALDGKVPPRPPQTELALWTSLDDELLREPAPYDGSELVLQYDWWKNDLGFSSDYAWNPFRAAALRRLLRRNPFDFSVIEDVIFWRYAEIARQYGPVIIDYHNAQSRAEEEYLAFISEDDPQERERAGIAVQSIRRVEEMYRNVPAIVCSETEKAALVERGFAHDGVAVIYNTVDIGAADDAVSERREAAPKILFTGMMDYAPNALAAIDLAEEIFPRVRTAFPAAQLWIVGMSPQPELLLIVQGKAGIFVTGRVADTRMYFESASVLSVSLQLGGGTRFKILEAFKYGLPVVTSPKGCEGLEVIDRDHLLIATSAADHADYIIRLLQDPSFAHRLATAGRRLVREKYSFTTAGRQWDDCLRQFGLIASRS
ncbi:MAG TPA: glycosyltransferase [Thermoanaerobaculia bacterium]|nr:glycosyltransferase [Thermoanaerobaculia bacterium]